MRANSVLLVTVTIFAVLMSTTTLSIVQGAGDNRAQSESFDFTGQFDNLDCGGEVIDVQGTIHVNSQTVTLPDGSFKTTGHLNFEDFKGVGADSGKKYVITDSSISKFSFDSDSSSSSKEEVTFTFNVAGPDREGSTLVHLTFLEKTDSNGDVTFSDFKMKNECK
jgi:hypothetical protein